MCPPHIIVEAGKETLLPVGGYLAIANDCSCEVTDHSGTLCSYYLHYYGSSVLPVLICEIAFLTISVVIGMGGPSTGGSSDRWSESKSNSMLRKLWQCSNQAFCFESLLIDIFPASFFTGLSSTTSEFSLLG